MKLDCLNVKGFKSAEEATVGYIYEKEDNPEEYFQIAYAANGETIVVVALVKDAEVVEYDTFDVKGISEEEFSKRLHFDGVAETVEE